MKIIFVKIFAAGLLLAMLAVAVIVTKFYFIEEWAERSNGMGQEQQSSNCTLITAFFALASSNGKMVDQRHAMFRLMLRLRLPMVVFSDAVTAPFVANERHSVGMDNLTQIWTISLSEVPLWLNFSLLHAIYEERQNAQQLSQPPAVVLANRSLESAILANSKTYFLLNASTENPFNSTSFVWMDPTYGQGKRRFFPPKFAWRPKFPRGKISLLKLAPFNNSIYLYDTSDLYRNRAVEMLSTEFMAGDGESIAKFHGIFVAKLFDEILRGQIMFDEDDQQALLVALLKDNPPLFNVVQGEWFNAFHLF